MIKRLGMGKMGGEKTSKGEHGNVFQGRGQDFGQRTSISTT